ncbi:hypothetical protein [Xanthobacter aminoxidans]|uniref:hypothetical protein n=1 Tax=Xanthobacter aminoxidans TaxID=186280 RepID=UPI0020230A6C|nr:hypothetical protein [Xanthobacter aminoxidans]MCL8385503.1 hypothetical protein [Xanthobacter aminoxidans]
MRHAADIFMTTASGRRWYLLDPRPGDVHFHDIASHLAKICRFTGATGPFYSVAQHSVLVASLLPPTMRPFGLLHDAWKAYLGDIGWPLHEAFKRFDADPFENLLLRTDRTIHRAAGLPWPPPAEVAEAVDQADQRAFATEWRDVGPSPSEPAPVPCRPIGTRIRPQPWPKAEEAFVEELRIHLPATLRSVA